MAHRLLGTFPWILERLMSIFIFLRPSVVREAEFRVSNCLENQVDRVAATRHDVPLFSIALRIVSSLRMQAVNASFFAFPA